MTRRSSGQTHLLFLMSTLTFCVTSACTPNPSGIQHATADLHASGVLVVRIPLDAKTWDGEINLDESAGRQAAYDRVFHRRDSNELWEKRTPGAFGVIFPFFVDELYAPAIKGASALDYVIWNKQSLSREDKMLPLVCFREPTDAGFHAPRTERGKDLCNNIRNARVKAIDNVSVGVTVDQETIVIIADLMGLSVAEHMPTNVEVYITTKELGLLSASIPVQAVAPDQPNDRFKRSPKLHPDN